MELRVVVGVVSGLEDRGTVAVVLVNVGVVAVGVWGGCSPAADIPSSSEKCGVGGGEGKGVGEGDIITVGACKWVRVRGECETT